VPVHAILLYAPLVLPSVIYLSMKLGFSIFLFSATVYFILFYVAYFVMDLFVIDSIVFPSFLISPLVFVKVFGLAFGALFIFMPAEIVIMSAYIVLKNKRHSNKTTTIGELRKKVFGLNGVKLEYKLYQIDAIPYRIGNETMSSDINKSMQKLINAINDKDVTDETEIMMVNVYPVAGLFSMALFITTIIISILLL
jgi:hypothetical protein